MWIYTYICVSNMCIYGCAYTHVCQCMYVICLCIYIDVCLYTDLCMSVCTYLNEYIDLAYMDSHTCIHVYNMCIHVPTYTHIYPCMAAYYMYEYIHLYTIYTYIHTLHMMLLGQYSKVATGFLVFGSWQNVGHEPMQSWFVCHWQQQWRHRWHHRHRCRLWALLLTTCLAK